MLAEIHACDDSLTDFGAETGSLFLEILHQLRAGHSFMISWEVFYFSRGGELSAGLVASIDDRLHVGSRRIDRSCESGGAGTYYKAFCVNLVHICLGKMCYLRSLTTASG